jgi:hypothetical protein
MKLTPFVRPQFPEVPLSAANAYIAWVPNGVTAQLNSKTLCAHTTEYTVRSVGFMFFEPMSKPEEWQTLKWATNRVIVHVTVSASNCV